MEQYELSKYREPLATQLISRRVSLVYTTHQGGRERVGKSLDEPSNASKCAQSYLPVSLIVVQWSLLSV